MNLINFKLNFMRTKTTLPITEARKNIFSIAEKVQIRNNWYTLTERGKPKAVIISAKDFEMLTEKQGMKLMMADKSSNGYSFQNSQMFPKILVVRDQSKVVYLTEGDPDLKYKEEGLIKSQLYVNLIEEYKYPLSLVEIGRYVKVGGAESKRYIEADIIVNDKNGNVRMIFEVGPIADFEENTDRVVADLFEIAYAVTYVKKPECLIYYSRSFKNGTLTEKIITVDYTKFNTFAAWKKAGRPGGKEIPAYDFVS